MANEVSYIVRAQIETSGEERLANTKKALEDIQKLDEKPQSSKQTSNKADNSQSKTDNSQSKTDNSQSKTDNAHAKAIDEYLKQIDSKTKGFSMLAKSIESPVMLLGMLKEGLFSWARSTAQTTDQLQMSPKNGKSSNKDSDKNDENPVGKEEKANPAEQRLTIPTDLKQALKEKDKSSEKKNDEEKRLSVPQNAETGKVSDLPTVTMNKKANLPNKMLGNTIGKFAKGLGIAGGALAGLTAAAIVTDKVLKKMNEATLAAGERMAMLQTTGNAASADLSEWDNSLWGSFVNSIPILGAWIRGNKIENVADWTAYQPFAKLIPGLLDYKYKTGSEGSGADVAKKVTEDTGLDTGYDFATRFGILNKMSEYTGKDDDAGVTRELLSSSRVLGLDPDMLVDLIGNSLRYSKEGNGSIMTSIEKTAMDTGLDRSRYKELIRGFDEIIKKQISIGVPVKVENVSEMAGILGQAGDTWKGEQGLQIQMSMNDRLRQAGNLTSDEDVALMQWTMGENESYHDWRLEMDKGLTEGRFETMSQRFIKETGEDKVTGNLRLMNAFGLSSYTQADELRKLMIKMNGTDPESGEKLNDTKREEAQAEFQKKMNEIKDASRPPELEYLESVNTTMETTQQEVTSRLDSILGVLQEHLTGTAIPSANEEDIDLNQQILQNEGKLTDYIRKQDVEYQAPIDWQRNLILKFDTDGSGRLDTEEEYKAYNNCLKDILQVATNIDKVLEKINGLLEGGVEVEGG